MSHRTSKGNGKTPIRLQTHKRQSTDRHGVSFMRLWRNWPYCSGGIWRYNAICLGSWQTFHLLPLIFCRLVKFCNWFVLPVQCLELLFVKFDGTVNVLDLLRRALMVISITLVALPSGGHLVQVHQQPTRQPAWWRWSMDNLLGIFNFMWHLTVGNK